MTRGPRASISSSTCSASRSLTGCQGGCGLPSNRLRYQRGPGRMDGQVQPADHGPDGDVEDLFGNSQDLLDPGLAAAADQDQAKATDINHQRLFSDVAQPEEHRPHHDERYRTLRQSGRANRGLQRHPERAVRLPQLA